MSLLCSCVSIFNFDYMKSWVDRTLPRGHTRGSSYQRDSVYPSRLFKSSLNGTQQQVYRQAVLSSSSSPVSL